MTTRTSRPLSSASKLSLLWHRGPRWSIGESACVYLIASLLATRDANAIPWFCGFPRPPIFKTLISWFSTNSAFAQRPPRRRRTATRTTQEQQVAARAPNHPIIQSSRARANPSPLRSLVSSSCSLCTEWMGRWVDRCRCRWTEFAFQAIDRPLRLSTHSVLRIVMCDARKERQLQKRCAPYWIPAHPAGPISRTEAVHASRPGSPGASSRCPRWACPPPLPPPALL